MTVSHSNASDDFSHLSNDELAAAVATLAAHIHAATWRLLTLIAELDRRGVWADQGALTCAHWLGWACGIDAHTAREKVRVARALEGLPLLSAAAARGELGYSKLRALTRIATSENEADLVDIGLHGTAQHVEKFVRLYRRAERAQETKCADAQHKDRELAYWYEDDGTLVLHGRFPPETGARILSALDAAMEAQVAEQPASQWSSESEAPDVPGGTSGGVEAQEHVPAFSGAGRDDGALRFTAPNGEAVRAPTPREPSSPGTVAAHNHVLGLAIDSETAMAHWHGEPIDYDHAVMVAMYPWNGGGLRSGHLGTPESREEHLPANTHEVLPSAREPSLVP